MAEYSYTEDQLFCNLPFLAFLFFLFFFFLIHRTAASMSILQLMWGNDIRNMQEILRERQINLESLLSRRFCGCVFKQLCRPRVRLLWRKFWSSVQPIFDQWGEENYSSFKRKNVIMLILLFFVDFALIKRYCMIQMQFHKRFRFCLFVYLIDRFNDHAVMQRECRGGAGVGKG